MIVHNIALQIFKEDLISYLEPEPSASIEHREADHIFQCGW